MSKKDYYEILGVPRDADENAIKSAYRKLVLQHHPDVEGGNRDKFGEVDAAYQTLRDTEKRTAYDLLNQQPAHPEGNGSPQHEGKTSTSPGGFNGFGNLYADLFASTQSSIFDMGFGTPTPPKAEDHLDLRVGDVALLVALIEAYSSTTDGKWEISRPKEDIRKLPESMYRVVRKEGEVTVFRKVTDWQIYDYNKEIRFGSQIDNSIKEFPLDTYFNEWYLRTDNDRFNDIHVPGAYHPYLQALKTIAKKIGVEHLLDFSNAAVDLNRELRFQSGTAKNEREQSISPKNELVVSIPLAELGDRLKAAEGLVRRIDGNRTPEGQNKEGVEGTNQKG